MKKKTHISYYYHKHNSNKYLVVIPLCWRVYSKHIILLIINIKNSEWQYMGEEMKKNKQRFVESFASKDGVSVWIHNWKNWNKNGSDSHKELCKEFCISVTYGTWHYFLKCHKSCHMFLSVSQRPKWIVSRVDQSEKRKKQVENSLCPTS